MSPGEKLEHILATILLMFVAIIMVTTCSKAMAGDPHHDHGRSTDYIVIKDKENDNAKEFAIGIAVTTTLVCAYKRFVQGDPCYKSKARKTTEADDKVTP